MRVPLAVLWVFVSVSSVQALNPMDTVHSFCRADGRGERIQVRTWASVAPLIQWGLEPAWDRVILIHGYEVSSTRYEDEDNAVVNVTYHVAADIEGGRVIREPREEKRAFRLVTDETRAAWYIAGPPPPPHVFISQVDPEEMAASFDADTGSFLSNATFVQRFLSGAGWELAPFSVRGIPALDELSDVRTAAVGDIVLYYDGDAPYHAGVLESEDGVLSATLNGGIRRAPVDAFAGTVRYRRPRASWRVLTPTPAKAPTVSAATRKAQGTAKTGRSIEP